MRLAGALYRLSARVLPSGFRSEYGAELESCFLRIATEARRRGLWALASVTARSVADLLTRAPREHLAAARAGALVPGPGLSGAWQDVRQAARRLRRRPSFALASVLTLALGIGAATSVFSLVHGVVLSPLSYPESDRIVQVDHAGPGLGIDRGLGITYGFYRFYAERVRSAESMGMYSWLGLTLTGAGEPVKLRGIRATPTLGVVLGISPLLGRWFSEEDGVAGAAPVVVLSHGLWRERFGGDPGMIGRSVHLESIPHDVVGVARDDFAFPSSEAALWVPRAVPQTGVGGWNDMAVARLGSGVEPGDLERELAGLLPVLRETTDDPSRVSSYLDDAGIVPRIVPLKESVVGDVRATLWILMGTVGLVLLIALANVANLFLVRAEESQRETALRAALGAGGARRARACLAETLLLAGTAGALGVAFAAAAVAILKERAPVNVPRLEEVGLDPVVLTVTGAAVLVTALVLGLIPSLRRLGDLSTALREGAGRTTSGRRSLRGRNVLVATQVALAMVLLIGSGLLFRTFAHLRAVDLGFEAREALTFQIGLPYPERAEWLRFHRDLRERLGAIPGVGLAAAVGQCLPLTPHMCWGETLEAEGHPVPEGQVPPVTGSRVVSQDYFEAMGIPVRGRTFRPSDETGEAPAAILSASAAEAYFGGSDALGQRIRFGSEGPWYTVVGVARDVRGRVESEDFLRAIYLPMLPSGDGAPPNPLSYVLRTSVPAASVVGPVRRIVADLDPAVPVSEIATLQQRIDRATAPTAFALTLIGVAAIMALLLGAVGVYAVVAYAVSRRTAEIGVRIALGAAAKDVRRMVLRQGGGVVLAGVGIGLLCALVLTRFLGGMLHGISPSDPLSYGGLAALMLAVAGLALYLPARRASKVQPLEALRGD